MDSKKIGQILKNGGLGILPTDTIYGIVGSALNPIAVEKIYNLRKRAKDKPMIILISDIKDLNLFEIKLDQITENILENIWPNSVSVVLPCPNKKFEYLHRGKMSLAFRLPKDKFILDILQKSGPIVAPSANFEGEKPSVNIKDAKEYFKDSVDFYFDAGDLISEPSTLIEINNGSINVLRQGKIKI